MYIEIRNRGGATAFSDEDPAHCRADVLKNKIMRNDEYHSGRWRTMQDKCGLMRRTLYDIISTISTMKKNTNTYILTTYHIKGEFNGNNWREGDHDTHTVAQYTPLLVKVDKYIHTVQVPSSPPGTGT